MSEYQTVGPGRQQKESVGRMGSAGIVARQADDWQSVDAVKNVERELRTLACNSPPGTAELFRADIRMSYRQACS